MEDLEFFKPLIKDVQSGRQYGGPRKSYEGIKTQAKLHIMSWVNTTKRAVGASPKRMF